LVCGRDVESLKIKLFREKYVYNSVREEELLHYEKEYVEEVKYESDVRARTQAGKKLDFIIPKVENPEKYGSLNFVHPTLQALT